MADPVPHHNPAHDAEVRDRLLAQREAELARIETTAAAASADPAQRVRHQFAAGLHERAAAAHQRDAARHHLEAEVQEHGLT